MIRSLCPCGHKIPDERVLAALNGPDKQPSVVCSACARLLFVAPFVWDAETQLTLFDMKPTEDQLIEDARIYVGEGLKNGVECPCCDQQCKLKKVVLTRTLVDALYELDWDWTDSPVPAYKSKHYKKLRYWGLVEEKTSPETNKGTGFWRVTKSGVDFLRGKAKVPLFVYTYNNRLHSLGAEVTGVTEPRPDEVCHDKQS